MTLSRTLLALAALATPAAALAGPGNTVTASDGSTDARVVEPLALQPLKDLRFGSMPVPTTAGTVTVAADSTVTSTGGMNTALFPTGRGASVFLVHGTANRQFITYLPTSVNISNGTATMKVDSFRKNGGSGPNRIAANGYFLLYVGGRLNAVANQAVGHYTGTFKVQVLYL